MAVGTMFDFWINQLFGNLWLGIIAYACILAFIGTISRMGLFLMVCLLALYLVTMAILFGGLILWVLLTLAGALYFANQIIKFWM